MKNIEGMKLNRLDKSYVMFMNRKDYNSEKERFSLER